MDSPAVGMTSPPGSAQAVQQVALPLVVQIVNQAVVEGACKQVKIYLMIIHSRTMTDYEFFQSDAAF